MHGLISVFQYFFIVWSTGLGALTSGSECSSKTFVYLERILKVISVVCNTPWVLFVDGFLSISVIPVVNIKILHIKKNPSQYHETNRNVLCSPFRSDFKNNAHITFYSSNKS